jgi:SAM-dependent methyltransferase
VEPRLQRAQAALRGAHALVSADSLRYAARLFKERERNRAFRTRHPSFALPPSRLAYEAHNGVSWGWYKESGEREAAEIVRLLGRHGSPAPTALLEWGCGPGRIVRHLPGLLPATAITGTDYDPRMVAWCAGNIEGATFVRNRLAPPLPFADGGFEVVYAVSVVTHLSAELAQAWALELARVLAPDGLLLLWTNGDPVAANLLPEERRRYAGGECVVRGGVAQGRKWYLAFHPDAWTRGTLLRDFVVEEHMVGGFGGGGQDVWVARRSPGA